LPLCYNNPMPKLHDLCQQFWEEITSVTPGGGQKRTAEEVVAIAYEYLKKRIPRDADVLNRHLKIIADEMNIGEVEYDDVEQLTESLFG
jgi:hypothetical protein